MAHQHKRDLMDHAVERLMGKCLDERNACKTKATVFAAALHNLLASAQHHLTVTHAY